MRVANIIDPVVETNPPVRIYTPESPIRRPSQFFAQIFKDLRASRVLAWRLFVRDVSALYRQTAFGYLLAVLPPIVTTLVWILLNSSNYVNIKTGGIPYPVFVLAGTMFFQLFVDALNAPLRQLSSNRSMLNRVNFPIEALLISGVGQVLFSFAIKAAVLAAALAVYGVAVHWTAVFLIFPIVGILALGTVIGVLLAPIGMLYKDIEQGLVIVTSLLMFLTPVVYPPPGGYIGKIMDLNPLTPLFTVTRELLYGNVGSLTSFAIVFTGTLAVSVFGWASFRLAIPILVERLDA